MRLFMGAIKCAGCLQIVFTGGIAFLDVCLTGWRHPLSYRMPPARAKKRYIQTLAKEMRRLCFKALTIKLSARAGWHRSACTLQKHRKRWGRKFSKMSSVVVKSLNVSFFFFYRGSLRCCCWARANGDLSFYSRTYTHTIDTTDLYDNLLERACTRLWPPGRLYSGHTNMGIADAVEAACAALLQCCASPILAFIAVAAMSRRPCWYAHKHNRPVVAFAGQ